VKGWGELGGWGRCRGVRGFFFVVGGWVCGRIGGVVYVYIQQSYTCVWVGDESI